jgi:putative ABC transport system permease protein
VLPKDAKSATLLKARINTEGSYQVVQPTEVVSDILSFVFRIKAFLDAYAVILAIVTVILLGLVLWLSGRLRRRDLETLNRLGASRLTVSMLQGTGMAMILFVSLVLTGSALLILSAALPDLVRILR